MNREAVGVLVDLEKERLSISKRIETLKASLSASGENVTQIENQVKKRLANGRNGSGDSGAWSQQRRR